MHGLILRYHQFVDPSDRSGDALAVECVGSAAQDHAASRVIGAGELIRFGFAGDAVDGETLAIANHRCIGIPGGIA
jgi:hypothetical protein